jgi:hypothetical protein
VVAVGDDLGDDSGSRWRMMKSNKVGDDVGNEMGNNNGRADARQWWG